ncbi:MAG: galactokinase [Acidimicrobiia bacterium]|nr:galactokinase [Acidimicrobiia bacterium]
MSSALDPSVRTVGDRRPALRVRAFAPGRVNLIGEHTDYTGGLALPMAVHLGTTIEGRRGRRAGHGTVDLGSTAEPMPARIKLPVERPERAEPVWARYVAGVLATLDAPLGLQGTVTTTLPVGAGLSSSASLELAVALAAGFEGTRRELALAGQHAEQLASGVPCGLMDQTAVACGLAGHALRMDFTDGSVLPVDVPEEAAIVVVDSGQPRRLADSGYATRRAECEQAAEVLGPLRTVHPNELTALADPRIRARARHVVTENERVDAFVAAMTAGDLRAAGAVMNESHTSLRNDFEVSTPTLDDLVEGLRRHAGVHGARLTGAGFGGCVVALTEPDALADIGWHVRPSEGATLEVLDDR